MLFHTTILSEFGQVPRANLLPNIAEYCARLAAAGFVSIEVTDATGHCLGGFRANLAHWAGVERRAGRMTLSRSLAAAVICKLLAAFFGWSCKTYLLVSARQPSWAQLGAQIRSDTIRHVERQRLTTTSSRLLMWLLPLTCLLRL